MPIIWIRQAYVQKFDCETITFQKDVNIPELMEIEEYVYEGVVEPYYKKSTRKDTKYADHRREMRGEAASSNTDSNMSEK